MLRHVPKSIFIPVLAGVALTIILALNWLPSLRGGPEWQWLYAPATDTQRVILLAGAITLYVIGAWFCLKRQRAASLLVWAIIGGVVLTVVGIMVRDDPAFELAGRTVAGQPTGFHYALGQIDDFDATLRDWPAFMRKAGDFSQHMRLSPPGLVLAYYYADRLLETTPSVAHDLAQPLRNMMCRNRRLMSYDDAQLASAWLGMLTPLWGALTVLPLFWIGRRLFQEQVARWAVLWWPLVPGFLMFTPTPNTFYPLLGTLSLAFLIEGVLRRRALWLLGSGVVLSVLTFFSLSVLPLILMAGLVIIGLNLLPRDAQSLREMMRRNWRRVIIDGLWLALGLASVWLIYYAASGVFLTDILPVVSEEHLALDRPYGPWLFWNLNDFLMFAGWPLIFVAAVGVWQTLKKVRQRIQLASGDVLSLSLAGTLSIFILSGTLRGETGRVLLFLAPLALLTAGQAIVNTGEAANRSGWLATAAQSLTVVLMLAFIPVIGSGLKPSPVAPPAVVAAAMPCARSRQRLIMACDSRAMPERLRPVRHRA